MKRASVSPFVGLFAVLLWLVVFIAIVWGWVLNIIVLAHTVNGGFTGMVVLRAIGVLLAPLGAVLGFFA